MSPLTKSLVVVVAVLAVVLVALIVPFAAKVDNWKERYEQEQLARSVAEQKANLTQADIEAATASYQRQVQQLNQQVASLQGQVRNLTAARQEAETNALESRNARERAEADMRALTAASEKASGLASQLTEQTQRLQERLVDQQTRNIQLADTNNQLSAELSSLTRQVRRMRETMLALEEQNRQLAQGVTRDTETTDVTILPTVDMDGSITRIDEVAGTTLVLVDVGQRDGVQQNMKFMIHRNNQFVGNLLIETVDTDNSAGRIVLASEPVQVGDKITAARF